MYDQILTGHHLPAREEEIRQLHLSALNLAGAFAESNERCAEFEKSYPHSLLLPEVLFRRGENNLFLAAASTKPDERERLSGEASRAYRTVIERFPEFPGVDLARYSLAQIHYRKGEYEKAQDILEKIRRPTARVNSRSCQCFWRLPDWPDSHKGLMMPWRQEKCRSNSTRPVNSWRFCSNQPDHALVPDALLRLGLCQQRLAAILSSGEEQKNMLKAARLLTTRS